MKIKKESKQSQVGPGTHFPCDVPGHPQPLHRAQADPFAALSAGEAFQGESIYMELKLLRILRPRCFHITSAFPCTLFLREARSRAEADFWFLGSWQGFSFPVFSNLLTSSKSSPSSYFCYKTLLTLQVPSPQSSALSPLWWLCCWTSYSDWSPTPFGFIIYLLEWLFPVCVSHPLFWKSRPVHGGRSTGGTHLVSQSWPQPCLWSLVLSGRLTIYLI